jgi:Transposase DDE domain
VRYPGAWYQIAEVLSARLPALRPAQARGLATWVYGALAGGSACETAVLLEWEAEGLDADAVRQRLREFLRDGPAKAAPCATQVDVAACFAPLLAWLLEGWPDGRLALAVDATNLRDALAVLAVSALYGGCAIPVAWAVVSTAAKAPGQASADWAGALCSLLRRLRAAIPPRLQVLVLVDRGLRSPRLRRQIRRLGFRPLLRLDSATLVQPAGTTAFVPARTLVAGPGAAWVGRALVYKQARSRVRATLVVVWDEGQRDVWVLLTDLRPRQVGVVWYGLRMWVELGFRALKGLGWQWQRTRRTEPRRVARHWLVLAVATLWALAAGTRAAATSRDAARGRAPRRCSLFARGRAALRRHVLRGSLRLTLRFLPDPWPEPGPRLRITYHLPPLSRPP